MCASELSYFFMISDLTYSTVICYEACKFPVMDTLVLCVPLSHISLFMICDLTYSTVTCTEVCKFPITVFFMCHWVYLSISMICDITISTVIWYKACKFPIISTLVSCVPLSYLSFFMISNLTYSIVICCEVCKSPVNCFMCYFELSYVLWSLM